MAISMLLRRSALLPPQFFDRVSKRLLASTMETPWEATAISQSSGRATANGQAELEVHQSGPRTSPYNAPLKTSQSHCPSAKAPERLNVSADRVDDMTRRRR
eukprot:7828211-Pyramimonas_sp.AAC.1